MITERALKPAPGYVEKGIDGVRVLVPTDSTKEKQQYQSENKLLKAQLKAQTERSDFLEDCLAEMANVVYGGE